MKYKHCMQIANTYKTGKSRPQSFHKIQTEMLTCQEKEKLLLT